MRGELVGGDVLEPGLSGAGTKTKRIFPPRRFLSTPTRASTEASSRRSTSIGRPTAVSTRRARSTSGAGVMPRAAPNDSAAIMPSDTASPWSRS